MKKRKHETSKEKSQFTHPLAKGWLRPYLYALSNMFDGRWLYWARTIEAGRPLDDPIPKIDFDETPHLEATKNLKDCVSYMQAKGYSSDSWMAFVDWLLWGFGAKIQPEFPIKVTEEISWYWYKTFNLGLLIKHPYDYMMWGSLEVANMSRSGNRLGYFPTPTNISKMMTIMTMTDADKTKTVADCCVGTGIFLMHASNYSLRLFAQDISLDMCKMTTANGFIYAPWIVTNADHLIDWNTAEDYQKIISAFSEWQQKINTVPMLTFKEKSNNLTSWL